MSKLIIKIRKGNIWLENRILKQQVSKCGKHSSSSNKWKLMSYFAMQDSNRHLHCVGIFSQFKFQINGSWEAKQYNSWSRWNWIQVFQIPRYSNVWLQYIEHLHFRCWHYSQISLLNIIYFWWFHQSHYLLWRHSI